MNVYVIIPQEYLDSGWEEAAASSQATIASQSTVFPFLLTYGPGSLSSRERVCPWRMSNCWCWERYNEASYSAMLMIPLCYPNFLDHIYTRPCVLHIHPLVFKIDSSELQSQPQTSLMSKSFCANLRKIICLCILIHLEKACFPPL